jgi:hypothetical protein
MISHPHVLVSEGPMAKWLAKLMMTLTSDGHMLLFEVRATPT